jgi:hypothetical protein
MERAEQILRDLMSLHPLKLAILDTTEDTPASEVMVAVAEMEAYTERCSQITLHLHRLTPVAVGDEDFAL